MKNGKALMWYDGGCGGIRTPVTCDEHVSADYRSGPLNHSGTHPHARETKPGFVASRFLAGERRTTTRTAILCKGMSQRFASCFFELRVTGQRIGRAESQVPECAP